MSRLFFPKLALTNIRKNSQTYVPYILTCIGTIMMYYIIHSMTVNDGILTLQGAGHMALVLALLTKIVAVFAVIFLFYTNSFLQKRRSTEMGLYNILGLEKRHIGRMLFWETVIVGGISLSAGIALGLLFSKLMFLLLILLMQAEYNFVYEISFVSIRDSLLLFGGTFLFIFLTHILRVKTSNPIELLRGGQKGEKEPKVKWYIAMIGMAALGAGYFLALRSKTLIAAINNIFPAILLVMAGTYCLFTAGSIAVLKGLKKNKRFYYKLNHYTTVSGMLYRMKQNAVGLANICILSTAVLVTLAATISLYVGQEENLNEVYPHDISYSTDDISEENVKKIRKVLEDTAAGMGLTLEAKGETESSALILAKEDGRFVTTKILDNYNFYFFQLVPASYAPEYLGESLSLEADEVVLVPFESYGQDEIIIQDERLTVKAEYGAEKMKDYPVMAENMNLYFVFMKDRETIVAFSQHATEGQMMYSYDGSYDLSGSADEKIAFYDAAKSRLREETNGTLLTGKEAEKGFELATYGGFLFLGVFLGVLFLMATALIIYYKQVAEGYQDKERFHIMQKVGMGLQEVKKTIHTQVLMVFFLPLAGAVVHLAFAYNILRIMLSTFGLMNEKLFLICTCGCILGFTLVYGGIYAVTARTYYKIVSVKE